MLETDAPGPSKSPALVPAGRLELRGDLDNIVRKAMHKDPDRRYASPERLSGDIGKYLEKPPIDTRTLTYGTERFVARNRIGVVLACVVLLIVAAAAGSLVWQVHLTRCSLGATPASSIFSPSWWGSISIRRVVCGLAGGRHG